MRKPAPSDAAGPVLGAALFLVFYVPVRRYLGVPSPEVAFLAGGYPGWLTGLLQGRWSVLFPVVDGFKHGPGEIYVTIPFMLLFGHTPAAMFWRDGAFAVLAVAATWSLGLALYRDRWAAFLACVLLATSPGFVLYSMVGGMTGIVEAALAPASLYLLLRYADERRPFLAYRGFACLGFALACRTTMAAFVLGLLAFAILYRRAAAALLPPRPEERRRLVLFCLLSFALCLSPFVAPCALDPRGFWSYWIQRLFVREEAGSNLDYGSNLLLRLRHVGALLADRDALRFFVFDPGRYPASSRWFLGSAASAGAARIAYSADRREPFPRRWLLPWVLAGVFLLVSPFSPSRLRVMHLFPLLPLVFLACCSPLASPGGRRWRAALISAYLLFAAFRIRAEVDFFRTFYADLARSGIRDPNLSASTLELSGWLARRPGPPPIFFAGPADAVWFLTGGTVRASSLGGPDGASAGPSPDLLDAALSSRDARFVAIVDPGGDFDESGSVAAVKREASRLGLGLVLEGRINRPDGDPIFAIYRAAP
jgi:4-amino-4-deoxy-L-arabinose transferase-like glycosyltransferase